MLIISKLPIISCKLQFIRQSQAILINFEIIILSTYCENQEVIKIICFLKLLQSPSYKVFSPNVQASWNLGVNTVFGEQLVRCSSPRSRFTTSTCQKPQRFPARYQGCHLCSLRFVSSRLCCINVRAGLPHPQLPCPGSRTLDWMKPLRGADNNDHIALPNMWL